MLLLKLYWLRFRVWLAFREVKRLEKRRRR